VGLERLDLVEHDGEARSEGGREVSRVDDFPGLALRRQGAGRERIPELAQESAQSVDALDTRPLPLLADPVELLDLLLLDRAYGNRADSRTAVGLEQRVGIGAIGFVAAPLGPDVLGRQQLDLVARGQ
jgi:hypothetical protein